MVGLQPMMKGRLRKPLIRWAMRTGNSLCRYLALLYKQTGWKGETHTHHRQYSARQSDQWLGTTTKKLWPRLFRVVYCSIVKLYQSATRKHPRWHS
jgi:hypothetical protein